MNYLRFTGEDNQLLFTYGGKDYIITSMKDWLDVVEYIHSIPDHTPQSFQCSSSIDFPEEYTDNEELLAICDAVRGNS